MVYVGVFTKIGAGAIFFIVQFAVIFRDVTSGSLRNLGYGVGDFSPILSNSFYTLTIALGSLWTLSVLRETTRLSDSLNMVGRPLSIVVAGDSGVGKDTFVNSVASLIGQESVTIISGDGYHKHERGHLKWFVNTHLNPLENQIVDWSRDFRRALQREDIYTRQYDHANGRFEYLGGAKPRDVIIGQGLHAFYGLEDEKVDVKMFLEMEEKLRFHYKVARDTSVRGHSKSKAIFDIKKRKSDYIKYIEVQRHSADLIIRQECANRKSLIVDTLIVSTKDFALADFLFMHCSTMIRQLVYRQRTKELQQLVLHHVQLISSSTIEGVLKQGFNEFDDYFTKENEPNPGSAGLISALTLMTLAFKRKATN
jgi:uridine kinase